MVAIPNRKFANLTPNEVLADVVSISSQDLPASSKVSKLLIEYGGTDDRYIVVGKFNFRKHQEAVLNLPLMEKNTN